jgi:5-methylcytosine-specific restriction endonuclease McrA
MWMQFDHLLPHSRGGGNDIENVVVTCAPCNYGRWHWTLEEVGLIDPRTGSVQKTSWDGLERILRFTKRLGK